MRSPLILLFMLVSASTTAGELLQSNAEFSLRLKQEKVYNIQPLDPLQEKPAELLDPSTIYPQTLNYPIAELQSLYRYATSCKGVQSKQGLPESLIRPLQFLWAECNNKPLPLSWFAEGSTLHPGGGSYAARYIYRYPDNKKALARYLHLRESAEGISKARLSDSNLTRLVNGDHWILQGSKLWLQVGNSYRIYSSEQWRPIAKSLSLNLSPVDDRLCPLQLGAVCWRSNPENWRNWLYLAVTALMVIFTAIGTERWLILRRRARERQFVFHRISAHARKPTLLAPDWCGNRWSAMVAISNRLAEIGGQGSALGAPFLHPQE